MRIYEEILPACISGSVAGDVNSVDVKESLDEGEHLAN